MMLPVEKNKCYKITIDGLGSNGEGVGRVEGFTVFVEGALPGETIEAVMIKVKKSYGIGKLIKILEESPDRVVPRCPVARQCGGCQLQHLSYGGQLAYKTQKVVDDLQRIGGLKDIEVLPTIGMDDPWRYRNKAQFPVGQGKNGLEIGFYAKRSHRIVDTPVCFLQDEWNDRVVAIVRGFIEEFQIPVYDEETGRGLIRHIMTRVGRKSGEKMICLVVNGWNIPHVDTLVERLKSLEGVVSIVLNENIQNTNVILGEKMQTLWGKDTIMDNIGDVSFEISPLSFYQVNPKQTEVLYKKAVELAGLTGKEMVLDLYCGIGTISLFFAKKAMQVIGIEIVSEAIADAQQNGEKNGVTNTKFVVGAAEKVIPRLIREEQLTADVIIVDPPRKGCDQELLEAILQIGPRKVIYVSCDPATLSRDLTVLCKDHYRVETVQPVDQFPMTTHIETVTLMIRADKPRS